MSTDERYRIMVCERCAQTIRAFVAPPNWLPDHAITCWHLSQPEAVPEPERVCCDCGDPLRNPGRRCTTCQLIKDGW